MENLHYYLVMKEKNDEILATFDNIEDSMEYGIVASAIYEVNIVKIEINPFNMSMVDIQIIAELPLR